jgi:copper chaperone
MNQSLQVTGMTCGHCEMSVTKAIKKLDPQAEVKIDRASGKVEVETNQPREALAQAIADQGFAVAA